MPGNNVSMDYGAIQQAHAAFQRIVGEFESDINTIVNEAVSLEASWNGQASGAFQTLMQTWKTDVTNTAVTALQTIGQHMLDSSTQMQDADTQLAKMFNVG